VTGPPLVPPETPDKISETVIAVWTILSGAPIPPALSPSSSYIDNRDVARLMVWAVDHAYEASGERYITIAGAPNHQAIADVLSKHYTHLKLDKGTPGDGYLPDYASPPKGQGMRVDSSKAVKATGEDWIGFEKSTLDAAKVFERYL
jgi:nucleoside-diphosphate-sugar epimerase